MKRRKFLANSGTIASVAVLPRVLPRTLRAVAKAAQATDQSTTKSASRISFETSASKYQNTYAGALEVLARNTTAVSGYAEHVLIEGSNYGGIWLECAPHEGLVYSEVRPDVARNNHLAFFALQKEDGQIPCWSRTSMVGFGQIQMVVPIAATAWELSQATGDSQLVEKSYLGCGRWDAWLRRYRDTRHTVSAKASAPGIQDMTTARVGPEFPIVALKGMRASACPLSAPRVPRSFGNRVRWTSGARCDGSRLGKEF